MGSKAGREFPEGTSLYRPETSRIVRIAFGFIPPHLPRLTGNGAVEQQQHQELEAETKNQEPPFVVRVAVKEITPRVICS